MNNCRAGTYLCEDPVWSLVNTLTVVGAYFCKARSPRVCPNNVYCLGINLLELRSHFSFWFLGDFCRMKGRKKGALGFPFSPKSILPQAGVLGFPFSHPQRRSFR